MKLVLYGLHKRRSKEMSEYEITQEAANALKKYLKNEEFYDIRNWKNKRKMLEHLIAKKCPEIIIDVHGGLENSNSIPTLGFISTFDKKIYEKIVEHFNKKENFKLIRMIEDNLSILREYITELQPKLKFSDLREGYIYVELIDPNYGKNLVEKICLERNTPSITLEFFPNPKKIKLNRVDIFAQLVSELLEVI